MKLGVNEPKWTVLANTINPHSKWGGTSWDFFDDEEAAEKCYGELAARGACPTKRPFYRSADLAHMQASSQFSIQRAILGVEQDDPTKKG